MSSNDKDLVDGEGPEAPPQNWMGLLGGLAKGSVVAGLGAVSAAVEPVEETLATVADAITDLAEGDVSD